MLEKYNVMMNNNNNSKQLINHNIYILIINNNKVKQIIYNIFQIENIIQNYLIMQIIEMDIPALMLQLIKEYQIHFLDH